MPRWSNLFKVTKNREQNKIKVYFLCHFRQLSRMMVNLKDRSIKCGFYRHQRVYREVMSTTHPLADFGFTFT